jgi:hypothetical protein
MVSTMKMNACRVMISRWKMIQPRSSTVCSGRKTSAAKPTASVPPISAISEHQLAGEDVAEQSQPEAQGLGQLLDQGHDDVHRDQELAEGMEQEHLEIPAQPLDLDIVEHDQREHRSAPAPAWC